LKGKLQIMKNENAYTFHVIPNTHWDREWLYNFQETRMFLVEFMDKLLDIFASEPSYKSYLLDSQTVPIEDYLQVRPERLEEIRQHVKEKRLFIGPWYTLPEEHLVNGESLVRNLLIGHRVAAHYGGVMKVGYSPFSYGQASQMPQIYQGFGIDTILFYHGITPDECKSEFIFEGADGSQLFASRMGSFARYNFFFNVFRPMVYAKEMNERTYQWQEEGLPFHLCTEERFQEHHILLQPKQQFRKDALPELLAKFKEIEKAHCATKHIAGMQGMDSTQPDRLESRLIEEAAKLLHEDEIFHSSLPEWIAHVKAEAKDLVVLKGERRTPRMLGTRPHLYGDVTSARTRLKQKNARTENVLQRKAEPFAVFARILGAEYPKALLEMAWKYLLKCHPHDSIAGTGVDQIENDMHYRLDQARNIVEGVTRRAMQNIQRQIDNSWLTPNQVALTVFNPSPYKRSEVLTAVVDLPDDCGFSQYALKNALTWERVGVQEACRYEHPPVVRHLGDATMEMPSLRVHFHFPVEDLPALGYRTYFLEPTEKFERLSGSMVTGPRSMENEYLKVEINQNGSLKLTHKASGRCFDNLHYFEDSGEAGHAWRHVPPAFDRVISTLSANPQIELRESGPLVSRFAVIHRMNIPSRLEEGKGSYVRRLDAEGDDARRSEETREIVIESTFTLRQGAKALDVETTFVNTCNDHRLRVMFPTYLAAKVSSAEAAFDVVDRPIDRGPDNPWRNTWNPTHPQQRFVDVSDGKIGLAIINNGLREYEVTDDATRTIGVTLLRAFEVALTTVAWRWERHPEMKLSQSPGEHKFRYLIYPHLGNWDEGDVFEQAEYLNVSIEIAQAGRHKGTLPKELSFLEIVPNTLELSAMKQAEDRDSMMVRIFNPTDKPVGGELCFFQPPKSARLVNFNEEPSQGGDLIIEDKRIKVSVGAKKIVTVEIYFE